MKDKIKKEVLDWLDQNECDDEESVSTFIDLVMDKTTEVLVEEIKKHLKNEFTTGNLKHDFIISPDYYLELKLKEAVQNFTKNFDTSKQQDQPEQK